MKMSTRAQILIEAEDKSMDYLQTQKQTGGASQTVLRELSVSILAC